LKRSPILFLLLASFAAPIWAVDKGEEGLAPVEPGDLLASTGFTDGLLIDINPATGAGSARFGVGDFGPVAEIQFRADGILFATGGGLGGGAGTGSLSIIDPDTGAETLLGSDPPGATAALEFVGDVLYGAHTLAPGANSTLVIVDQSNGVLNEIGDIGFSTVAGLAYDESKGGNTLLGTDIAGNLISIDMGTGAGTLVGNTGFTYVTALEFGPDGTLYGGMGTQDPNGGSVITIDPVTGAGAMVGPTGFFGLSGLAFVPGAPFTITAAFSGAWYDATENGHGFLFQVLPGGVILVYWFTYDSEGNPTWFFGVGTIDGNQVEFDLLWEPSGPNFPPDFDPDEFNPVPWGTLIIIFFDCNTGMAEWDSKFEEFGAGEMDLERITSTDTLDCEI